MKKIQLTTIAILTFAYIHFCNAQTQYKPAVLIQHIDSILTSNSQKPFNGVILVTQNGETVYSKACGYSDLENQTPITINDQFVIGSVSKQFTAAIVLREYDKGNLDLYIPIRKYLPSLSETWADSVTIHHLLTHTHGIIALDKPTAFPVGTQCRYSNLGYNLLASIAEATSGKSFIELSAELFETCGMHHTYHPETKGYKHLVKGYIENEQGELEYTDETFSQDPTSYAFNGIDLYPAAGTYVSTVEDLVLWNSTLFGRKLLKESTFQLMTTKQENAIRKHSLFGSLQYGYGITIDNKENILQWGQTGYAPGFVSMNFYFPQSKTAVILLENVNYDVTDVKKTFYYHVQILDLLKSEILK